MSANYIQFIKPLSAPTWPLEARCLVTVKSHKETNVKMKDCIWQDTYLECFRVMQPMILQVDASHSGLGATVLQGKKPTAFSNKTLTQWNSTM